MASVSCSVLSGKLQDPFDLGPMERVLIDLNKHALDLNEIPLADLNLGLDDPSPSTSVLPLLSSSEQLTTAPSLLGSEPFPVKKGGWLELFRNMFGNGSMVSCIPISPLMSSGPSCSSSSCGAGEFSISPGEVEKHNRIVERDAYPCKRLRRDTDSLHSGHESFVPEEKNGNKAAENMNANMHDSKFHQSHSPSSMLETTPFIFKQRAISRGNVSQNSRLLENEIKSPLCESSAVVHDGMHGQEVLNQELKLPQEIEGNSHCSELVLVKDSTAKVIPSPEWLPPNWVTELKIRKTGSTAGTTDKYYKDPITGHRFRSKNEVMNYLRTGSVRRYTPQIRSSIGETHISHSFQAEGSLEAQLESNTVFHHSVATLIEKKNLDSSPVSRFASQTLFGADNLPFEAHGEGTFSSQSVVPSEEIVVKQEEEEMSPFHGSHKAFQFCASPTLPVQFRGSEASMMCELSRSQRSVKRLGLNELLELPSKYKCFNVKEGDVPIQYHTWTAYLTAPLSNSEWPLYGPNGVNALSPFFEGGHSWYGNTPGFGVPLLNTSKVMQEAGSRERIRKLNPVHLKGCNYVDRRKYQPSKAPIKKPVNLTIKQSRELLISLGKKICQQYLESTRKTAHE